jgi:hypothetical protein
MAICPIIGQAQQILACQYTHAEGFKYHNRGWSSSKFKLDKPFFIKIKDDGLIDISSIEKLIVGIRSCERTLPYSRPEVVMCIGSLDFLGFNTKTLEGAKTYIAASTQDSNERDTIFTEIFTCQKI